ncbi:MAG: hypothetical protein HC898_05865 [Phycisphaerales bacterium]|nr:hypothetical protein [Phycisphaerales bacterium]
MTLAEGQTYNHADDGGAILNITPGLIVNPNFNRRLRESASNPRYLAQGTLTITTYGIRSGGSVLVDVASSEGGISITGTSAGSTGRGELSKITLSSAYGRAVTTNPLTGQLQLATTGSDVNVALSGSVPLDVLDIVAPGVSFTTVSNTTTDAQIIGINASSIGSLISAGSLGLANSRLINGMILRPNGVVAGGNTYPFVDQGTAIIVNNIIEARAAQGLGNFIVGDSAGTITPNSDNLDVVGVFEGIAAPIFANNTLYTVNIGEGLAPTGSGEMANSGLYAGAINLVRGTGTGNDIWGDIISNGGFLTSGSSIGEVNLTGGSIIGSVIGVYTSFDAMSVLNTTTRVLTGAIGLNNTATAIGKINLTGAGGILSSIIEAYSIGDITVRTGFGIYNTTIYTLGNGRVGNVSADGYGIRDSFIQGGSGGIGNISATGRGQNLLYTSFSPSVRLSDFFTLHPIFNLVLDQTNDLALALGNGQAGIIDNLTMQTVGNAGSISAYRISNTTVSVANRITGITTLASIDAEPSTILDTTITTGTLGTFNPGGSVSGLSLYVAGRIGAINIRGDMLGNSIIEASGENGSIDSVRISGDLDGTIAPPPN